MTALQRWIEGRPAGGYELIMADPPWPSTAWSDGGLGRAPEAHYQTMPLREIMDMPVEALAARDCLLWLWARPCMMPEAYQVMRAWGFEAKTVGWWVKLTPHGKVAFGLGKILRDAGEPFIVGTIGAPKTARTVRGVIHGARREHSRKPEEAYRAAVELMPLARRLDLFSRQRRPGWDAFGNEVERFDA